MSGNTFYWISLVNPHDDWHDRVVAASKKLGSRRLVTTDEVLIDVLAFFGGSGEQMRGAVARLVRHILGSATLDLIPQSRESFLAGLSLYEERPDKSYSLADRISMQVMRSLGLTEVLTHDHHFVQAGFVILLKD